MPPASKPQILFVRSGGGLPGLDIHVGIWRALAASGIEATHCAGTSAGAVVSAFDAAGYSAEWAEKTLRQFADSDIRDERRAWRLRLGWIDHIFKGDAVRALLNHYVPDSWSYYGKPIRTMATRQRDAAAVNTWTPGLSKSPAQAVLASLSIPAVFPPVLLADGCLYEDGGLRRNVPMPRAWSNFDKIYVCLANGGPRAFTPTGSVLTTALRAFDVLMADQTLDVTEQAFGIPNVTVLEPRMEVGSMLRFNHDLIDLAFTETMAILNTEQS